jgi:CRISPR/Cas system-associated protein Cas5 (RAMP superfamily)
MGDVWNGEYKNVALSLEEKKKMMYILSKSQIHKIKVTNDDDISTIDNMSRNFVGELMYYKEREGLVESINTAIGSVGGKLKITDIFKVGDGQAKKVTDEIKNIDIDTTKTENISVFVEKFKSIRSGYDNIMKRNASFTIEKEQKDFPINILVFSPLDRTIFNMKVECK